ncbi:MAG: primosomal protein N', partial [Alphaproteobacteria bacterium]|nr:primosomal protein N' [Alphaproteobacteria bacterium]
DEAHEQSFKQEDGVPYHARDTAVMRARYEEIPVILASATPALETFLQVERGQYSEIRLDTRFGGARLPDIQALDLLVTPPNPGTWLAPALVDALAQRLGAHEQSLLYLNRRGYAPLTLCRTCGHRVQCPNCSSWMVEHRQFPRLQCHHCGHSIPLPSVCPACGDSESLVACGPGVERIAQEVATHFPEARVAVATSDTLDNRTRLEAFGMAMQEGRIDIVVGTQIVTKGYHFPNLTLVGVIDADLGLQGGDLRGAERCFQQISQVAGRAGRAAKPGQVMIQTRAIQSSVIQSLLSADAVVFYETELRARYGAKAPPYARYAALIISSEHQEKAENHARQLVRSAPRAHDINIYGPAPAPLAILRGLYRYRLLIHAARAAPLQDYLMAWLTANPPSRTIRVMVDVDPYNFS